MCCDSIWFFKSSLRKKSLNNNKFRKELVFKKINPILRALRHKESLVVMLEDNDGNKRRGNTSFEADDLEHEDAEDAVGKVNWVNIVTNMI